MTLILDEQLLHDCLQIVAGLRAGQLGGQEVQFSTDVQELLDGQLVVILEACSFAAQLGLVEGTSFF